MSEPVNFSSTPALAPTPLDIGFASGAAEAQADGIGPSVELGGRTTEVVLVTRNSQAELARSLPAIQEAAAVAGAELLFVDLGSVDGTQSFAAKHAPGARAVWLEERDGLIDALGAAAACSSADVLVVLNPTLEPGSPSAFAQLVEHLDEHPYAAVAAPALRAHNGDILCSARPEPREPEFARVEWVLDAAIAIRTSDVPLLAKSAGRTENELEALQLCLDLRRRGREVHYVGSVELLDTGGRIAKRVSGRAARSWLRSWPLLVRHPRYALRLARPYRRANRVLTRAFDICVALFVLTLLSPVLLAIVLAIRLESRGPALFRQVRLGRDERPFQMYKFRTMRSDADPTPHRQYVREMIVNQVRSGPGARAHVFKLYPDPRVTRVGRLLRRTSLDELPQLLNVLRGDMCLVGFRPPIPYEVSDYPGWYHRRFAGKPGITGLWQVSGRNELSYEEMVRLDIEYLNRQSWLLDGVVLVRTVGVVVTGRGAY
jgi:lipopolysaccharide/colanic/teichoic acid biosynthesis glycosyltransferase